LQVFLACRARAPCLTTEDSSGRRAGRLRQVVCTSRVGGWGPAGDLLGHHVGWICCFVPPLDPTAQRGSSSRRRQRQCTALLPATAPPRPAARTRPSCACTWSPQPAARFPCGAPPGGTRFRRDALASTAGSTSAVACTGPASPRGTLGCTTVYPGRAAEAAACRSPGGGSPAQPAPGRASCSRSARSPPPGHAGGRSLDPRRRNRVCRGVRHPRRAGLRRKQACR
jgi:hypothetical protein